MSPPGRPKIENKKEIKFSIRLDEETNTLLEDFAHSRHESKGEVIRKALDMYIKKESKKK